MTGFEPGIAVAGPTGFEPAASGVTTRCSNQTELRPHDYIAMAPVQGFEPRLVVINSHVPCQLGDTGSKGRDVR